MSQPQRATGPATETRSVQPYRRRHYFIDPGLQLRYLLHLSSVALVFGAGALLAGAYYSEFIAGLPVIRDLFVQDRVPGLLASAALMLALFVGASSILLSHRLAGPGYRFRKAFEQVANGKLGFRVHLRTRDELKSTAVAFNEMVDALESRLETGQTDRENVVRDIRRSLELLREADQPEFPEALRLLEECEARLRCPDEDSD